MDLRTVLLEAIKASPEPLTAAQVKKCAAVSAKPAALTVVLDDLAQAGLLHAFTLGKATAYCTQHPQELAASSLAGLVAQLTEPTAPTQLKAALPKALRPWFDEALARLIVKGQAWWLIKGKTKLVSPQPPRPSDLLSKPQHAALENLLAEVNRSRRTHRSMAQLLAWLDEEETLETSRTGTVRTTTAEKPVAAALTTDQLLLWYAEDRARSSSSMIPIPQTWKRYTTWAEACDLQPSPDTFRAELKRLYDEGRIILEPCERPQDLPELERDLQVPMAFGPPGYYWSVL